MSNDPKQEFLDSLLSQEQPLSSTTYEVYRAMLTKKLAAAEEKVRVARRVTIGVWVAAAVFGMVAAAIGTLDNSHALPQPVIVAGVVAMVGFMVLFYYGLFRVLWYFAVERRGPQMVQREIQHTMLLELTRKVDALGERLQRLDPSAS